MIELEKQQDTQQKSESNQTNLYNTPPITKQRMFTHPFSFKGRIRRLEFGLSYIIYFIWYFPMNVVNENDLSPAFAIVWLIVFIPLVWFLLAQGAKRCHDRNNSGWFQIIPFYGLWMLFADGDKNENNYGLPPK
jgi:uncharacterized membrane protein YhaH (DUF805 family)